jgi:hypothetical protein
MIFSDGNIA